MPQKFILTAQLQLQPPSNINAVVSNIRRQLSGVSIDVGVNIDPATVKKLTNVSNQIRNIKQNSDEALDSITKFGYQARLAAQRFLAFSLATGGFVKLVSLLDEGVKEAVAFQNELVKIAQVTNLSIKGLKGLTDEVTRLSTSWGVSSKNILNSAQVLAQAGLSADAVRKSLQALAKTEISPTFDNMVETTEAAVAIFAQFKISADELESTLGSINAVSAAFAVESSDLATAIRRTGGAFEAAGGSLNELLALFTSVRSTTRESAESIATGFRTIFTRLQRLSTVKFFKNLGIELTDAEGKFIGPLKAIERISKALEGISSTDPRFAQIVEELGGFRQVSKVIPLLQEMETTQRALAVAQGGQTSLTQDAIKAQESYAVQIKKVREEFYALIRTVSENDAFKSILSLALQTASAFIKVGEALEPLLPLFAVVGAIKLGQAIPKLSAGFFKTGAQDVRGYARGGLVPGVGNRDSVPARLMPGEFVVRKDVVNKIGVDTLKNLPKFAAGGKIKDVDSVGIAGFITNNTSKNIKGGNVSVGIEDILGYLKIPASAPNKKNIKEGILEQAKSYKINVGGLTDNAYVTFEDALEIPFYDSFSKVASDTFDKLGIAGNFKTPPDSHKKAFAQQFLASNDGLKGVLFEGLLSLMGNDPVSIHGAQRPIDFPDAPANIKDLFGLSDKYIEVKGSENSTKNGVKDIKGKIVRQLIAEMDVNKTGYTKQVLDSTAKLAKFANQDDVKPMANGGVATSPNAMLMPGEYVFSSGDASKIGYSNLDRLNKLPKFGDGGMFKRKESAVELGMNPDVYLDRDFNALTESKALVRNITDPAYIDSREVEVDPTILKQIREREKNKAKQARKAQRAQSRAAIRKSIGSVLSNIGGAASSVGSKVIGATSSATSYLSSTANNLSSGIGTSIGGVTRDANVPKSLPRASYEDPLVSKPKGLSSTTSLQTMALLSTPLLALGQQFTSLGDSTQELIKNFTSLGATFFTFKSLSTEIAKIRFSDERVAGAKQQIEDVDALSAGISKRQSKFPDIYTRINKEIADLEALDPQGLDAGVQAALETERKKKKRREAKEVKYANQQQALAKQKAEAQKFINDDNNVSLGLTGISIAGAVGSTAGNYLANRGLNQIKTSGGTSGVGMYQTGSAIGGAATGAIAGASIGSLAGPIGTAIGGVAGALIGGGVAIYNASKEVADQLAQIKFDDSLRKFTDSLDEVNKKLINPIQGIARLNTNINQSLEAFRNTDDAAVKENIRGGLQSQAINVETLYTKLITDIAKNNSGKDTFATFQQIIPVEALSNFAFIARLPLSDVNKKFEELAKQADANIKTQQAFAKAQVEVNTELDRSTALFSAFESVKLGFDRVNASLDAYNGKLNIGAGVADLTKGRNLAQEDFNAAIQRIKTIGGTQTGKVGELGQQFAQEAQSAFEIDKKLTKILQDAGSTALGGEGGTLSGRIEEAITQAGIGDNIKSALMVSLSDIIGRGNDESNLQEKLQTPAGVQEISKQLSTEGLKTFYENAQKYGEAFGSFTQEQIKLFEASIEAQQRHIEAQVKVLSTEEELAGIIGKAKNLSEVTLASQSDASNKKKLELISGDPNFNPVGAGAKLVAAKEALEKGRKKLVANPGDVNAQASVQQAMKDVTSLTGALEFMSNPANMAAEALAKLTKATEKQTNQFNEQVDYTFSDRDQRREMDKTKRDAERLAATGDIRSISGRGGRRGRLLSYLQGVGSTQTFGPNNTLGKDIIASVTKKDALGRGIQVFGGEGEASPEVKAASDALTAAYKPVLQAQKERASVEKATFDRLTNTINAAFPLFIKNLEAVFLNDLIRREESSLGQKNNQKEILTGQKAKSDAALNAAKEIYGENTTPERLLDIVSQQSTFGKLSKQVGGRNPVVIADLLKELQTDNSDATSDGLFGNTKEFLIGKFGKGLGTQLYTNIQGELDQYIGLDGKYTSDMTPEKVLEIARAQFAKAETDIRASTQSVGGASGYFKLQKLFDDTSIKEFIAGGSKIPQEGVMTDLEKTIQQQEAALDELRQKQKDAQAAIKAQEAQANPENGFFGIGSEVSLRDKPRGYGIAPINFGAASPRMKELMDTVDISSAARWTKPGEFDEFQRDIINSPLLRLDDLGVKPHLKEMGRKFARGYTAEGSTGVTVVPESVKGNTPQQKGTQDLLISAVASFGSHVDRLATALNSMPREITVTGNHTLEVILNGGEMFNQMMPAVKELMLQEITAGINKMLKLKFPNVGQV